MRARFHPLDGLLYVCGLQGWQTVGLRDGAFHRVRYTGAPVYMPCRLNVKHDGLEVGFTCALDKKTAEDPALVLVADLNVYAYSFQRILAPHTARGPVIRDEPYFESNPSAYQQTPASIGAKGGNVGLLDGSVAWKGISRMRSYVGSQIWGADGCFGLW